jgi:hypothetical protein
MILFFCEHQKSTAVTTVALIPAALIDHDRGVVTIHRSALGRGICISFHIKAGRGNASSVVRGMQMLER